MVLPVKHAMTHLTRNSDLANSADARKLDSGLKILEQRLQAAKPVMLIAKNAQGQPTTNVRIAYQRTNGLIITARILASAMELFTTSRAPRLVSAMPVILHARPAVGLTQTIVKVALMELLLNAPALTLLVGAIANLSPRQRLPLLENSIRTPVCVQMGG